MRNRLRELRTEAGKTQQEMAELLRVSGPAYSMYETGKREMNYESLVIVADYFGVSLDYLFGRTELKAPPLDLTPADQQLLQKYRALDGRGRRTVRAAVDFEARLLDPALREKD